MSGCPMLSYLREKRIHGEGSIVEGVRRKRRRRRMRKERRRLGRRMRRKNRREVRRNK